MFGNPCIKESILNSESQCVCVYVCALTSDLNHSNYTHEV